MEERIRELDQEDEPLSLAEELAQIPEAGEINEKQDTHIAELQRMSMPQLIEEAHRETCGRLKEQPRVAELFVEDACRGLDDTAICLTLHVE